MTRVRVERVLIWRPAHTLLDDAAAEIDALLGAGRWSTDEAGPARPNLRGLNAKRRRSNAVHLARKRKAKAADG